jgi:hypothetical protein
VSIVAPDSSADALAFANAPPIERNVLQVADDVRDGGQADGLDLV